MPEPVIQLNKLTEKTKIIGQSKVFLDTLQKLSDYSQHRSIAILLYGESGVGKSFLARSCGSHNFVSVNCGSVTDSLANSLFGGHIRGAFTDAKKAQSGFVASAEGGTLFLDEIGDLGLSAQPLLLTVIEEKIYIVVGENFPRKADIQIIAATNKDLNKMVSEGAYRGDLLERLTIKIYIPSLNERGKEDISLLCDYLFTKHENELNKECSSELKKKFLELALLHDWKNSNIRGLSNIIFQTVVEERIPKIMETSSEEINPTEPLSDNALTTGDMIISNTLEARTITIEDLVKAFFNPEETLKEMTYRLEYNYIDAVKDLSLEKASEFLSVKIGFYEKWLNNYGSYNQKIKIKLNKSISLRDIKNYFKNKVYEEMQKIFPGVPLSKIMKKLGEKEQDYYNRKKRLKEKSDCSIYLGHILETKENVSPPSETMSSSNVLLIGEEVKTVTTFPFDVLKSQLFDFFEDYKRLQIELEESRAKNKDLEGALLAVEELIKTIKR